MSLVGVGVEAAEEVVDAEVGDGDAKEGRYGVNVKSSRSVVEPAEAAVEGCGIDEHSD